jgi:hypothetical protein
MDTELDIESLEALALPPVAVPKAYADFDKALSDYIHVKSKTDLITFVRKTAPTLVTDFHMGRHIELLCDRLQKVADGEIKRLMVFLPPRSSKSLITSKIFPAWYIGREPNHEIMSVSHSDQLASDFGRSVRDIVNTEDFQKTFKGVQLRSDVKAAGKWKTNHQWLILCCWCQVTDCWSWCSPSPTG